MRPKVALHIAWRYLWAKKGHNAIQIVSGVSAVAVAVVTAAMICVLSVLNGFGQVVETMFSDFDPDLKVLPAEGKYFSTETPAFDSLRTLSAVSVFSEVVEETALVEYAGKQIPAQLKGVDSCYQQLNHIDSILIEGSFSVFDGAFERTVMGQGLAAQLGVGAFFQSGLHLYAPCRNKKVNLLRPDQSFTSETCFMAGVFAVNQLKYDEHYMLVSIELAQRLFSYAPHEVSAVELKLTPTAALKSTQQEVQRILGDRYRVLNRYEQQEDFFRVLRVEKLLTTLLMVFILLIASFNLVGSLTMLIIDKRRDIEILRDLGASSTDIHTVFLYEGWMISALGAVGGVVMGTMLCLVQQHFGIIKLGNGSEYILSAYPVSLQWMDVAGVLMVVLLLGFIAAWIPARQLLHPKSFRHEA